MPPQILIVRRIWLLHYFGLEYLAEKRSSLKCNIGHNDFCSKFVSQEWKSYKVDLESTSEQNFFYLNKLLSYFMARTTEIKVREHYLNEIKNSLLKEYVMSIEKEIHKLENQLPFDDVSCLHKLYDVMNLYYKRFQKAYKPLTFWSC